MAQPCSSIGNIGPLAGKPVMEGKGCLFKKFAGLDVFDIEINERDPDKLVDIIACLEPMFGDIDPEDIKAPAFFEIEEKLRERMKIRVPQRPARNGDHRRGGDRQRARVRRQGHRQRAHGLLGAGAAALACLDLLVSLGMKRENMLVVDSKGVLHSERSAMDESKRRYALSDRRAHAGRRGQDRRCLHGPVERRRAQARDGQEHGQPAADPGDGQPRTRKSCPRMPRRRAPT